MKTILRLVPLLLTCMLISSCSDDEMMIQPPVVRNTQTDMEILSRFIDINESTNEYYINENKKTRALSYVTGDDWKELERVSPVNWERCERNLRNLNSQVSMAINDPTVTYIVFVVDGKTLVKKLRDTNFDLASSKVSFVSARVLPYSLEITGGQDASTVRFKDASRTLRMDVNLDINAQSNNYFFQIFIPNTKTTSGSSMPALESVVFCGTDPLWNTSFLWTAHWAQGSDGLFPWEFKGKGNTPEYGHIAQCTFSY